MNSTASRERSDMFAVLRSATLVAFLGGMVFAVAAPSDDALTVAKADVVAIFTAWDYGTLMERVDPLVVRNISADEKLGRRTTFHAMALALGPLRRVLTLSRGESHSIDTPLGRTKIQTFDGKLAFENGTAKLRLQLARRSRWLVLGYNLTSSALPSGLATPRPLPKP